MISEVTLPAAFLVGLVGSTHCVGMCGGIAGAFTFGLPEAVRRSPARLFPYLAAYNGGRIASYALAGALLGWAGQQLLDAVAMQQTRLVGGIIAGTFMLALGLYIGGWLQALVWLERGGAHLWRHIEPIGRRLLPVRNPGQALALGLLWGWLPCGMVYAALAWSATAGSAAQGAALMAAFGLGTLPTLLVMGAAAGGLRRVLQLPRTRQLAGLLIVGFALFTFFKVAQHLQGHGMPAHGATPAPAPAHHTTDPVPDRM